MMSEAYCWSNNLITGLPKYKCKYDWPSDCSRLQCGSRGIVFNSKNSTIYKTAYFEAFPRIPISTFIRGEGITLEEAEEDAWKQWQEALTCFPHDLYSRGYADYFNGYRICKKCNVGLTCRPKYKQYMDHKEWLKVHGGLTIENNDYVIIKPTKTIQDLAYKKKNK